MSDRLDKLFERLEDGGWHSVRDSVNEIARLLAGRSLEPGDAIAAVTRVAALASHEQWEVRYAVANAAEHFDREAAVAVLARLVEDDSVRVQEAARRLLARRTNPVHADFLR